MWLEPYAAGYTYLHWGAKGNVSEPDNAGGAEYCAAANSSQAYGGGSWSAWGWSDVECSSSMTYVCKVSGGWAQPAGSGGGGI